MRNLFVTWYTCRIKNEKEYATNLYISAMRDLQISFEISEDFYSDTYKEFFSIIL